MPIPCQTPGCDHPNYHVCLVGKPDRFPELLKQEGKKSERRVVDDGTQSQHSIAAQERWARHREETVERDKQIIERYESSSISVTELARQFHMSKGTVLKILKKAGVEIRRVGYTIANGAS